jgi:plastocyanin domain-containing protein
MRSFAVSFLVLLALAACRDKGTAEAKPAPAKAAAKAGTGPVEISVTEQGFEPAKVTVDKGKPVTLAFTRKTDKTCAKEVVIDLGDGQKVEKQLPLDQRVEIPLTFGKTGELKYACSMDMVTGVIVVQ